MTKLPIIRTSERRDFGRCEWRWYQAWRRGLKPLGEEAPALLFGGWVHEALAAWYCGPGLVRGPHPAETFAKVADTDLLFMRTEARSRGVQAEGGTEFFIEEKLVPALDLGKAMLEGYVQHWGNDDSWHVIEPERSGEVDVIDSQTKQQIAIYGFTYDLIYRDLADGQVKLGEHKTAKAIFIDHLPLDPQAGSYWAIAGAHLRKEGLIGPREELSGITYNFLKKSMPDTRPINPEGFRTNKPQKEHYIAALTSVGLTQASKKPEEEREYPLDKLTVERLARLAQLQQVEVFGEVSALQPGPLFVRELVLKSRHQRASQIRRIELEAKRMNDLRGKGESVLLKNPTKDCSWDCRFHALCLLDEEGGDTASYRRDVFRVADPYAAHRKSTEE